MVTGPSGTSTGRTVAAPALRKAILVVGWVGLGLGLLIAWETPATGYELSIYRSTPAGFWIGTGTAFLAGILVCAVSCRDWLAGLGTTLGGVATVAIVGLPVIRGYRFYGLADSLTHLGWAREMAAGERGFFDLFYPGSHTASVQLAEGLGVDLQHALLLMIVVLSAAFVVFVPLVVRQLVEHPRGTAIAAFSAFMLLPFTNVSSRLMYHTYSIGTLFLPVLLFLLVAHITSPATDDGLPWSLTGTGIALFVVCTTMLFFHPQVTLNVIILLGTLVAVHLIAGDGRLTNWVRDVRPIHWQFLFLSLLWVVWVLQFDQVVAVSDNVYNSVEQTLYGDAEVGETAQSQGDSAAAIGASIQELFLKLFGVSAIYTVVALGVVVAVASEFVTRTTERVRPVLLYFGCGGAVLGPFFLLHFLGPTSHLFFRHLAFGLVFVTIVGAMGFHFLVDAVPSGGARAVATPIAVVLLAVALVVTMLVVFPSPYLYLHNHHASDEQIDGYDTAFDHQADDVPVSGVRSGPGRYLDAAMLDRERSGGSFTGEELAANPAAAAEEDTYLAVTAVDRDREVQAYRELRFSADSFERLAEHPRIHHVYSSGEFDLYYVEATGDAEDEPEDGQPGGDGPGEDDRPDDDPFGDDPPDDDAPGDDDGPGQDDPPDDDAPGDDDGPGQDDPPDDDTPGDDDPFGDGDSLAADDPFGDDPPGDDAPGDDDGPADDDPPGDDPFGDDPFADDSPVDDDPFADDSPADDDPFADDSPADDDPAENGTSAGSTGTARRGGG